MIVLFLFIILSVVMAMVLEIVYNKEVKKMKKKWNVNDLVIEISRRESGKKEIDIAQIREITKVMREILKERTGIDIYKEIKK